MQYRRRLRTRIILSFLALGFGLTALFAVSSLYLRSKLEGQLIDNTMQKEVDSLVRQARENPNEVPSFSLYSAKTWSARTAYKMPLFLQGLDTGVHNISQLDEDGKLRLYKYAIRRDKDLVSYVRYDVTGASLGEQQMLIALGIAVIVFSALAWIIGIWSSSRVISPVTELAKRVADLSGSDKAQALAPYFANDEVGELAATLDDYSGRMTQLVKRDREFNADVSHELRTPLAVIRGATELLLANPELPEKTKLRLQRIDRAALQCTDLTTALLMLSRNERGVGNTDIHKLANNLAEANRAQMTNKPVQILVDGLNDVFVNAPEAVLSVALGNLIGNACKYTQEGEVRIIVEIDRVIIQDTGPGLSEEDAARLFERGYRGSGIGVTTGGGIGLSIVRRLCDLYEWKVSIKPREETGAEACLVFDGVK
ncbi:MAG: HAMP domain-containing sensor histidine kinase [Arenimonas sp.]